MNRKQRRDRRGRHTHIDSFGNPIGRMTAKGHGKGCFGGNGRRSNK